MSFRVERTGYIADRSDLEEKIREAFSKLPLDSDRGIPIEGPRLPRSSSRDCPCRHDDSCSVQQEIERLMRYQRENDGLKKQIQQVSHEINEVKSTKSELHSNLRSAQTQILDLRSELEKQSADHQTDIRHLEKQFYQEVEKLKDAHLKQINEVQTQFRQDRDERDQRLTAQDKVIQDLLTRFEDVERKQQ
jgi:uncharacterized protein YllA (UPF0747 family)